MAIVIKTPTEAIKVGDIIQYQTSRGPTIHRVIERYEAGGLLWFITKGDGNNVPDDPINECQVMGKLVFTIPKLGWVSIYLKEFAQNAYTFLTATLPTTIIESCQLIAAKGVYLTTALVLTAYLYLLFACYKIKQKGGAKN